MQAEEKELQGYWQRAIAAKPGTTTKAYVFAGICWVAIPLAWATSLGLTAAALFGTPAFPGVNHVLTGEQISNLLIAPAAAIALMGKAGAILMLVAMYMAVSVFE